MARSDFSTFTGHSFLPHSHGVFVVQIRWRSLRYWAAFSPSVDKDRLLDLNVQIDLSDGKQNLDVWDKVVPSADPV